MIESLLNTSKINLPKIRELKELSKGVLVIYILVVMASILVGAEFGYVKAQNMMNANTTGVSMSNSTSDGDGTASDENPSNRKPSSEAEKNNSGEIAGAPKCLGSALCPD
jgi:hypothetical protein